MVRNLVVINLLLELGDLEEAVQVVPLAFEYQLPDEEDLLAVFEELCVCLFLQRQKRFAQILLFEVVLKGKREGLPV